MPIPLRAHILELEEKIVTYFAWKGDSSLFSFIKSFMNEQINECHELDKKSANEVHEVNIIYYN